MELVSIEQTVNQLVISQVMFTASEEDNLITLKSISTSDTLKFIVKEEIIVKD